MNCSNNGKNILKRLEKGTLLGEGSFGTVWSVRNIDSNEHYALKEHFQIQITSLY